MLTGKEKTSGAPSFREALRFWFWLGWVSFGGPAGQIALMHEYIVDKYRWISSRKFLHALNYCMLLPGPEAQQLAIYTGWLLHGIRGGLAAGVLFVLPSVVILAGLAVLYVWLGPNPWAVALFSAIRPAVVALVLVALGKMARKSLKGRLAYAVAIAAFVSVYVLQLPFPLIVAGAALAGFLSGFKKATVPQKEDHSEAGSELSETDYVVHMQSELPHTQFVPLRLLRQTGVALLCWGLPLAAVSTLAGGSLWVQMGLFFTQAALLTFGGAYAVLPYVSTLAVEELHWLSPPQMLDALALGETTPGPLVMVLAFVGFLAAWGQMGHSVAAGLTGLLLTTYYTFLPGFFFILGGAPLIEHSKRQKALQPILATVTAALTGVLLSMALYLARSVLFPGGFSPEGFRILSAFWVLVSWLALHRFQVGVPLWVGISAGAGVCAHAAGWQI